MLNPDGPGARELHSKTVNCALRRGDVLSMWTQGGGGYGPPAERDPAAIERDLREGKTTLQKSRAAYGDKGTEK
jgi:N-methylhydantoinase B